MILQTAVKMLHVAVALMLIALVLIQRGKGAEAGAAFGAGASGTVFGAQGSANFLSRSTGVLAALFFITSLTLAYFSSQTIEPDSVIDLETPAIESFEALPTEGAIEELTLEEIGAEDLPEIPVVDEVDDSVVIQEEGDEQ